MGARLIEFFGRIGTQLELMILVLKMNIQDTFPTIVKLLNEDADENKIAKLLHEHANVNMGGSTILEDHLKVAKKLKQLNH